MVELVMFLFFFLQGGIVQTVIWLVLGMWRGGGNTIFDALGSDLRVSIPSGYYIVAFSKKCGIMVCQNAFISPDCVPARMNCYRTQSRVDPLPFTSAPQSSHTMQRTTLPHYRSWLLQATAASRSLSI